MNSSSVLIPRPNGSCITQQETLTDFTQAQDHRFISPKQYMQSNTRAEIIPITEPPLRKKQSQTYVRSNNQNPGHFSLGIP